MFPGQTPRVVAAGAAAALLLASTSHALGMPDPSDPFNGWFNVTAFPDEQRDNVTALLKQARDLSQTADIYSFFESSCILQQVYPTTFSMPAGFVKPFAAFDKLFFVGQGSVASWAYNTTDGIVLIDALDNGPEAAGVIIPGLEALGFQGSDIKHLIITHEHFDHYGGARYIQETYGPQVYGSEAFWAAMEALPANSTIPPPVRNVTVTDGQDLVVGDTTFHIVATPGHTLGTISLVFNVTDAGEPHAVGFMGGTGDPATAELRSMKVQSVQKLARIAEARGVDALVSNHNVADHQLYKADMLAHRVAGESNPFVIGTQNYVNYLNANGLCTQVLAAREGMDLSAAVDVSTDSVARRLIAAATEENCHH
jgi:metallo-beta-lactamase class B